MNLGMVLDILTNPEIDMLVDSWMEEARAGIREVKIEMAEQEDF